MKKNIIILLLLSSIFITCSKDEQVKFEYKKPTVTSSEFTDIRDGYTYKCIEVNNQVWLAENFRYLPKAASYYGCYSYHQEAPRSSQLTAEAIKAALKNFQVKPFVPVGLTDTIVKRFDVEGITPISILIEFENQLPIQFFNHATMRSLINPFDQEYYDEYGGLYTLEAAEKYAPEGWRVPSDEDWSALESSFGMPKEEILKLDVWRGDGLGRALKEGQEGIGFNAKYAGAKLGVTNGHGTDFYKKGSNAYFWSSSKVEMDSVEYAITRVLYNKNDAILRGTSIIKAVGNSVRYIKK